MLRALETGRDLAGTWQEAMELMVQPGVARKWEQAPPGCAGAAQQTQESSAASAAHQSQRQIPGYANAEL